MKLFQLIALATINTIICYIVSSFGLNSVLVYMIGWFVGMAMATLIATRNIGSYGS